MERNHEDDGPPDALSAGGKHMSTPKFRRESSTNLRHSDVALSLCRNGSAGFASDIVRAILEGADALT